MGSSGAKPVMQKHCDGGSNRCCNGNAQFRWAVSSMQGWPKYYEDRFVCLPKIESYPYFKNWSYFAIFDGHAGDKTAEACRKHLLDCIIQSFNKGIAPSPSTSSSTSSSRHRDSTDAANNNDNTLVQTIHAANQNNSSSSDNNNNKANKSSSSSSPSAAAAGNSSSSKKNAPKIIYVINTTFKEFIQQGFLLMDEKLQQNEFDNNNKNNKNKNAGTTGNHLQSAISAAAAAVGDDVAAADDRSGSTAVCCFINDNNFFLAHCGDSRAIVATNKDGIIQETIDHKPYNESEKARIEAAGGFVLNQRVNGGLAVSRALGDFDYKQAIKDDNDKGNNNGDGGSSSATTTTTTTTASSILLEPAKQPVSPLPDVRYFSRSNNNSHDNYDWLVILACDGVFDVMSNEQLVIYVRHLLGCVANMTEICNQVIDTCLYKGSRDNLTVIIIAFDGVQPRFTEQAMQQEAERDKQIAEIVNQVLLISNGSSNSSSSHSSSPSSLDDHSRRLIGVIDGMASLMNALMSMLSSSTTAAAAATATAVDAASNTNDGGRRTSIASSSPSSSAVSSLSARLNALLPPGGGLAAKRPLIEKVYNEFVAHNRQKQQQQKQTQYTMLPS